MDQTGQRYQMNIGDETTNFFAAAEGDHHSALDPATAEAVANAVQGHPGLEALNATILDPHGAVNPTMPGLKHEDSTSSGGNPRAQHPTLPTVAQPPQPLPTQHSVPTDDTTAIAAAAAVPPPSIQTGTAAFYACPVRHCQFLGKKIPEIQRHMGRNQHKGIENRACAKYSIEQAYVPAALANTAMVVDREYKIAVCRNGSYILSRNEIPAHAKLCVMCQGFDESLTNQPDYQEIQPFVDLEPFKHVQNNALQNPGEPNYELGMLRRIAGTHREDNEDNDKRFLCIYCYNEGKLFTMGRKDGNHLYNFHSINPDNRASAWVPCRGMSYRLLGKGFCDQSKFYVAVKSEPTH